MMNKKLKKSQNYFTDIKIIWIARDKDSNNLVLYNGKPTESNGMWWPDGEQVGFMRLPNDLFPSVTFENSPKEVFLHTREQLASLLHAEFNRGFDEGLDYDINDDK